MKPKVKVDGRLASFRALQRTFFEARAKKDTQEGDIYIYDAIGGGMFGGGIAPKQIADAIDGFTKEGVKALNIYLNSPGGDVFDGVAMFNCIVRFGGKKVVHVDGLAASAASLVAMAGDEIITAPNAMWMIHNAWGFAIGNAEEMRAQADLLEKVSNEALLDTYAKRCGEKCSKEDIKQMMAAETWMNAEEALTYGFTDSISGPPDEEEEDSKASAAVVSAHPLLSKYDKTPEAMRVAARSPSAILESMERRLKNHRTSPEQTASRPAKK